MPKLASITMTSAVLVALFFLSVGNAGQAYSQSKNESLIHITNPFNKDHLGGQQGTDFDKPGKYSLVVASEETSIQRGESLKLQVLITGYGKIFGAKLFVEPSIGLIDQENSKVAFDIKTGEGANPTLTWGANEINFREGFVLGLHGMGYQNPDPSVKPSPTTNFFDAGQSDSEAAPKIMTENILNGKSVVTINLTALKNARIGNHKLDFVLTYFDGQQWQNSAYAINITVKSYFEEHQSWAWGAGILLVVMQIWFQILPLSESNQLKVKKNIWTVLRWCWRSVRGPSILIFAIHLFHSVRDKLTKILKGQKPNSLP